MASYSSNTAQGPDDWRGRYGSRRCGGGFSWRPLELVAMILGFVLFWPIGLAVIVFKIWQRRNGYGGDLFSFAQDRFETARNACRSWQGVSASQGDTRPRHGGWGFGGMRPTGNSAFDEWRAGELARLEEERRKLEEAEREFSTHIDELRRARDREEFDRFMAARRNRGNDAAPGPVA